MPAIVGLAFAAFVAGCAPKDGWHRTLDRACPRGAPAVVCFEAVPDQALELEVGGETILPGECAAAPSRGGSVRVAVTDERGSKRRRWISAPAGKQTIIVVRDGKRPRARQRRRCDGTV